MQTHLVPTVIAFFFFFFFLECINPSTPYHVCTMCILWISLFNLSILVTLKRCATAVLLVVVFWVCKDFTAMCALLAQVLPSAVQCMFSYVMCVG